METVSEIVNQIIITIFIYIGKINGIIELFIYYIEFLPILFSYYYVWGTVLGLFKNLYFLQ